MLQLQRKTYVTNGDKPCLKISHTNLQKSIAKKALMRKDLLEIHFPKYFTKFAELLECAGGEWIAGSTLTYAGIYSPIALRTVLGYFL